jgi:phage tail-like protein
MKQTEIKSLLPAVFQRAASVENETAPGTGSSGFLPATLEVMEQLQAPSERILAQLDSYFDPRRAPEAFVPFLARWVDLDRLFEPGNSLARPGRPRPPFSTGLGRLRELTASAAWLSKWRGTAPGLARFLRIATGDDDIQVQDHIDLQGQARLFHFTVRIPERLRPHRALIERIIESEKPAYTTYDLVA